ncbi:MAG: hypothetical protein ABI868_16555, partial [Acidobacteriota bacterium]
GDISIEGRMGTFLTRLDTGRISRLNSLADVATLAAQRLLPLAARGRLARGRAVTALPGNKPGAPSFIAMFSG